MKCESETEDVKLPLLPMFTWRLGNGRMNSINFDLVTTLSYFCSWYFTVMDILNAKRTLLILQSMTRHLITENLLKRLKIIDTIFSNTWMFMLMRVMWPLKSNMAELESSLTAIDWLTGLKVGVAGDGSWSGTGRRMLETNSLCGSDAASAAQSTEGGHQKPAYSYSSLIYLAIGSSAERRMTLSEIYGWICDRFPYYKTADPGWKVSPRARGTCVAIVTHYVAYEDHRLISPATHRVSFPHSFLFFMAIMLSTLIRWRLRILCLFS